MRRTFGRIGEELWVWSMFPEFPLRFAGTKSIINLQPQAKPLRKRSCLLQTGCSVLMQIAVGVSINRLSGKVIPGGIFYFDINVVFRRCYKNEVHNRLIFIYNK